MVMVKNKIKIWYALCGEDRYSDTENKMLVEAKSKNEVFDKIETEYGYEIYIIRPVAEIETGFLTDKGNAFVSGGGILELDSRVSDVNDLIGLGLVDGDYYAKSDYLRYEVQRGYIMAGINTPTHWSTMFFCGGVDSSEWKTLKREVSKEKLDKSYEYRWYRLYDPETDTVLDEIYR